MTSTFWLSTRYFTFFFTWGVFLPFWTVWLVNGKGFTVEEAGLIISMGLIVRSFATLYIFPYLCRIATLSQLAITVPVISYALLILFMQANSFGVMFILTIVFSLFYPILLPLNETIASILSKEEQINYGRSRLWGSVGYIVALMVVAITSSMVGEKSIIYIMLVGCIFIFATGLIRIPSYLHKKITKKPVTFRSLFQSKKFLICISICILLQGAHAAYYNYGVIYLKGMGIDPSVIGIILILAVVAEIIFFSVADKFFQKYNLSMLFAFASIASIMRWLLVYAFADGFIFVISQLFHAFTFGVAHYAFMRYVNTEIEKDLIPSAQGIYASLGMSLSTGVLTFIGGYLYSYSPSLPFLGMALASLPCLLLSLLLYTRYEKKNNLGERSINHEA